MDLTNLASALHLDPAQIAPLALLTGGIVRALQPRLPSASLPWVAMGLGALLGLGGAAAADPTMAGYVRAAVEGLLAGCLAIAGKDSLKPLLRASHPRLADALFGSSKAGQGKETASKRRGKP